MKLRTTAIWSSDISAGTWPQPGNSATRVPGFTATIVRATSAGNTLECSPRRTSTGQVTRYHASQKKSPSAIGNGRRSRVMCGS